MSKTPHPDQRQSSDEIPFWNTILHYLGIDIRAGEGWIATLVLLYSGLLFACFYTGKVVRQSTFVDSLGAVQLPLAYFAVALTSYPILRVYGRLVDRFPRRHLSAGSNLFLAVGSLAFWWWFRETTELVSFAFYLWVGIAFGISVSQFWSFANHLFDPQRAKRLFALIAAGGALGGMFGSQLARLIALHGETRHVLIAAAVMMACLSLLIYAIDARADQRDEKSLPPKPSKGDQARGGLQLVFGDKYLKLVALTTFLSLVLAQFVDLQFNWVVENATNDLSERTSLFGNLFSLISISAFVFQIFLTSRIHRNLGVGFGMRVLPFTIVAGTSLVLLSFGMLPEVLLATVFCLKVGEGGFRHSIEQVTRELLFLPVRPEIRSKAKAYIDVFVTRFGRGAAALVLLSVSFGLLHPMHVGWVTLVLGTVWLTVTLFTHKHYIRSYRDSLQTAALTEPINFNVNDMVSLELLFQGLGSTDPKRVLNSIDLLESNEKSHLIPALLLHHESAQVRIRVLGVLSAERREEALPLIRRCLSDSDPEVRATVVRTLAGMQGEDVCALMQPEMTNPDFRVRAAAIACLACYGDEKMVQQAGQSLVEMSRDADPRVRAEAAKSLQEIPDPHFQIQLVQFLYDQDHMVVRQAIRAVQERAETGFPNPMYVPTLISLMRERRLKHVCRQALVASGEAVIPALVHFMNDTEEHVWVRRAIPKTIAQVGGLASATALIENLTTRDSFLRHKVIEALGTLCGKKVNMTFAARKIREAIHGEASRYMRRLGDLHVLRFERFGRLEGPLVKWNYRGERQPTLLHQLLAERLVSQLSNLLGLISLLYPKQDLRAAERNLVSIKPKRRSNAVEYLDSAISGDVHRFMMAVIGDTRLSDKLKTGAKLFQIESEPLEVVLTRLILEHHPGDPVQNAIAAAAVYRVYAEEHQSLYPLVERMAAEATNHFVLETAEWVWKQIRAGRKSPTP
ncbi:MFS transporter [Acanthopleuribacter pedis]|uniref:MFS transporter n=1 Tax=Acanthopleuribacter pedis TaxID=442870 RepID=A0A8J7U2P4_9BACT|nr:MFS transporter [Acanthopleuribacter pedis]MBO1318782.1 MFS transporter [Acanthopleuribacter pedis]